MTVPQRTVVVVHGIGQQSAGATATAWIESFLRFLEAQGRRAEVVENRLDADDGENCATLVVGRPGTARDAVVMEPVLRLRIVEARWADAFEVPGALRVLQWLLWFAPNLAHAQVFLSRRAHRTMRDAAEDTIAEHGTPAELTRADAVAHRATSSVGSLGPVLYLLGGLVLLAVAGPIVLLLSLLAVLATLIPSDSVRSVAAKVLTAISAQVGDVSTYLTSPVARGAMEEIIDRRIRIEVARAGVEDVHVLAHSQGAALTHAVLLRMPPALRPRRFTTLGGAHGRLNDMRLLRFSKLTTLPIALTAVAWLFAFPIHGRFGWEGLVVAPLGISVLTLVALLLSGRAAARRLGKAPSPGVVPGASWLDVWAPFDPVHNGRPVEEHGHGYLGQTVPGRMTFVLDHVYYEKDWNESVPRVLAHVTAGLTEGSKLGAPRGVRERRSLRDPGGEGPNWTPWSRRDWVSFACRGGALVTAIVLVAACGAQIMALGAWLRGMAGWAESAATWVGEKWALWWALIDGEAGDVVGGTNRVIGGVVVLLAAIVIANIVKGLYWGAVGAEARVWALSLTVKPKNPDRWSVGRWTARGGLILLLWAALVGGLIAAVVTAPWT